MNRTWLNLGLAVGFAIGVLLLWRFGGEPPAVVAPPQRSDYALREFELITLDAEGQESFTVRGPYLQRDIAGKSLSLVEPRFSFPDSQSDGRWNARAERAWVSESGDEVHLLRSVHMAGPKSPQGFVTRFSTARLLILPDVEQASADGLVTITQGDSILTGTGLRADMKTKRIELQNQVKGRYAPR